MVRFACSFLTVLICGVVAGQQSDAPPKFEIADVHVSAKGRNQFPRGGGPARGGRFEMKTATMVDLIRTAYGYSPDRILEGPNWIEMDRYDVIAKVPEGAGSARPQTMLQALLEDRFKLKFRKEERPYPTYALVMGKKPLMKPADGSGDSGCKPKAAPASGPPPDNGVMMLSLNGARIVIGPDGLIEYNCRNMSMADFAQGMRQMFGAGDLGQGPVKDETGLEGIWNFDVRWSIGFIGMIEGQKVTMADAVEKQLGLKLDKRMVPTPVLIVESVNRKPTDNPPGVAEALPPVKTPTEFEVADVKPAAPGGRGMGGMRTGAGGRITADGIAMRVLLIRAFNTFGDEDLVGVPDWANTARFNINAKASSEPGQPNLDLETMGVMIRNLLADRFKMTWHIEERQLTAYTLVAAKPKMKPADPKVRASCRNENPPPGSPPATISLVCHDVTMEQFADQLQGAAQGLNWPVTDSTELQGGWDFTLTYSRFPQMAMAAGPGRGGDAGMPGVPGSPLPSASEPSGAYTIFEAVEKQLGLKLSPRKRSVTVTVIDHLEQTPTDN
jgi:uncharacterized protein (TIGR03435 family)